MNNKNKGFTLIELLVVIAVIGILASVILVSLSESRNKGDDGAIKRQMTEIRNQAETFYAKYTKFTDKSVIPISFCDSGLPSQSEGVSKMLVKLSEYSKATTPPTFGNFSAVQSTTNTVVCRVSANGGAYAISVKLNSPTTTSYFCLDSSGRFITTTNLLAVGATICS